MKSHYIFPDWNAPKNVHAVATTRQYGFSTFPYNEFNLADHVGDDISTVNTNRNLLSTELQLPNNPCWLTQTHSSNVAYLTEKSMTPIAADAAFTDKKGIVCSVLTADCLPILLCDKSGTKVAAIHAGWRGILNGIIENTCAKMNIPGKDLIAWLGPAIGQNHFAVRDDVYNLFTGKNQNFEHSFKKVHNNQWLTDIYSLARQILHDLNVDKIYGGKFCTYTEDALFFSYRRDGEKTGRMACLIRLT